MAESFGALLTEARMRRGLSIEQVSTVLRIRPAILRSLEKEDFYGMPLKGHSRNMVSAYARYLGLDAAEITRVFLRNYRDFETSSRRPQTVYRDYEPTPRRQPSIPPDGSLLRKGTPESLEQLSEQGVRSIWDKPLPRSELGQGFDSRSPEAQRAALDARRRRVSANNQSKRGGGGAGGGGGGGIGGSVGRLLRNTPLPLIALIILLIALLIIWAVVANSCSRAQTDYLPAQTGQAVSDGGGSTA
ncbi:MAG: helix-turn-helix domain-containing protein, partial [Coriobacteriia bacterium]|nr:helix-turn-helix domain-containing protein [Coriobacteriia bacterium]